MTSKHAPNRVWTFIPGESWTDPISLKRQHRGHAIHGTLDGVHQGFIASLNFGHEDAREAGMLMAAAPDMHDALIEAAQAAHEAYEQALRDVPEGSCVPPWLINLERAAERSHAALVKADERFKARAALAAAEGGA